MASKQKFSPIKTGVDPRTRAQDENRVRFLQLKDGEFAKVVVLVDSDEIISIEQCAIWKDDGNSPVWTYLGEEDPSHDLDIKRVYRAFLPVLTEDGEQKLFAMGKQNHSLIMEIAESMGELAGGEIRIKRVGTKLNTRYHITSTGNRKDISKQPDVDILSILGPLTIPGVQALIAEKLGVESYQDVLDMYKGKSSSPAKTATSNGKSKPKPVVEEDEEEDEDLELS